ncbi:hypothetical protein [Actinoplanes sp. NPDC049265]|uniref:hypothetical protein n=1 Tax=Actinoplanes sp. NPDC049265 TaxID=3363902 RepID=UPI003715E4D3
MSYRIEDVLESVQEGAPAPRTSTADIIAGARRIQTRRRWAAVAGAGGAALVTVTVVAGLMGTMPQASAPAPPAAVKPSKAPPRAAVPQKFTQPKGLESTVAESRTGPFQIGPAQTVSYGHQEIPVYRDGKTIDMDGVPYPVADGLITVYRPGIYNLEAFGVSEIASEKYGPARDLTVAGRPGVEREYSYSLPNIADMRAKLKANPELNPSDSSIKQEHFTRTALAWKYDGTAWATFLPSSGREPLSRADSLAIAEALRPQAAGPVRAPYTFGWMRSGVKAIAAMQNPADLDELVSKVIIDKNGPTGRELVYPAQFYPAGAEISVWHGRPKPSNAPAKGQTVKCVDVNGYCAMVINDEYHLEFQKIGKGLTMEDARHIMRELKFTDLADQKTWKPVG